MKTQPRREAVKNPVPPKKAKKYIASETAQASPPIGIPLLENQGQHPRFPTEHHYSLLTEREKCGSCVYKDMLIQKYQKKKILVGLNRKLNIRKTPFTWRLIKSDHKINFLLG